MTVKRMRQYMDYIKCICSLPQIAASVRKIATGLAHYWGMDVLQRLELCM